MTVPLAAQRAADALRHADDAVLELILAACPCEHRSGIPYYDTRTLLDQREVSNPTLDMHQHALRYGFARSLIRSHPNVAHLVRINTSH